MIYLIISVLLVSAGVFLFLFSFFYSEKNVSRTPPENEKKQSGYFAVLNDEPAQNENTEKIKTVKTLYSDSEEVADLYEDSDSDHKKTFNNSRNSESAAVNYTGMSTADTAAVKAVLFEDSSGAVDYSTLSIPLDLSADYSGIKRIGVGGFSIDETGYSFISDKKLYRFDVHRIRDIKAGKNYLALMPLSDSATKLFIFDKEYPVIKEAEEKFSPYRKG